MRSEKRTIRKIACVGEVMIELVRSSEAKARLGVAGDTYNTAVYLARLLKDEDVSVSYITALGIDPYSETILKALRSEGIDDSYVERRIDKMPGLHAVDTDETGERSFSYWRSDSAARTLFSSPCDVGLDVFSEFDLVFLSGITMAVLPPLVRTELMAKLQAFSEKGGTLAYDSNHRPRLWESSETARDVTAKIWAIADVALPSLDDEILLFGDRNEDEVIARLSPPSAKKGALKRGALGPLNLNGPTPVFEPAKDHEVVDTTAAGDSFNAGYLSALVRGHDDKQALATGHRVALQIIHCKGAIIPSEEFSL